VILSNQNVVQKNLSTFTVQRGQRYAGLASISNVIGPSIRKQNACHRPEHRQLLRRVTISLCPYQALATNWKDEAGPPHRTHRMGWLRARQFSACAASERTSWYLAPA
jgi:hypothetical protein